ncbi:MAG: ABC transporter ATP-binding protein [Staphylococcus sp.]|nr:ABC transporter ATP-binding protein [Staphylococcus sp.]
MLKIDNLTFSYQRKARPVLDHFNLRVEAGGVYGLLGRNGAGKSTLLYLIAGALTPNSGKVLFKDTDTRLRLPAVLSDIFIVPEEFTLPRIPLHDYVKAAAPLYPRFSMEDLHRHLAIFDMDPNLNLGALSMGQKKKAFMSFALACNTSLLLMDEPTNGLDIPGKSAFRRFIAQNMTDERTIIISTHQVRDIDRLLDHVIIMDNSRVLFNRPIDQITSKLQFLTTTSPELISSALYAQPSLEGTAVILPNTDGTDTDLNLETLFELSLQQPDTLAKMFTPIPNPKSDKQ